MCDFLHFVTAPWHAHTSSALLFLIWPHIACLAVVLSFSWGLWSVVNSSVFWSFCSLLAAQIQTVMLYKALPQLLITTWGSGFIYLKKKKQCRTIKNWVDNNTRIPSCMWFQEVKLMFPGAQRMNRGNHEIPALVQACKANSVTDLVIMHETRGQPGILALFTYSFCCKVHPH